MKRKQLFELLALLILIIVGAAAIPNAVYLGDRFITFTYNPDQQVQDIAAAAGFSDRGRLYFYRYKPRFVDQQAISQFCDRNEPVLGCVGNDGLYIANYTNDEEYNRTIVTAAHEMLHVAFSRLDNNELSDIKSLISIQIQALPTAISNELTNFKGGARIEEAYVIIGSEVEMILPELENHYSRYFTDRTISTTAYTNSPEARNP